LIEDNILIPDTDKDEKIVALSLYKLLLVKSYAPVDDNV
jgi:hypothetical protein